MHYAVSMFRGSGRGGKRGGCAAATGGGSRGHAAKTPSACRPKRGRRARQEHANARSSPARDPSPSSPQVPHAERREHQSPQWRCPGPARRVDRSADGQDHLRARAKRCRQTSLLRAITGQHATSAGEVRFNGVALNGLAPYNRAKLGVGFVPQGAGGVSAADGEGELLETGYAPVPAQGSLHPGGDLHALPDPENHARAPRGRSFGRPAAAAGDRPAMVTRPKILVLDEPTEGIQPSIIRISAGRSNICATAREWRFCLWNNILISAASWPTMSISWTAERSCMKAPRRNAGYAGCPPAPQPFDRASHAHSHDLCSSRECRQPACSFSAAPAAPMAEAQRIGRPQRAWGRGRLVAKPLAGRTRLQEFYQEGCAKIRLPEMFDGRWRRC